MKQILITGVSSGLGHGLASEYLRRGDIVFGISRRNPSELVGTDRFHFSSQDLADFDATRSAVSQLIGETDELDLVVLNAGVLGEIADMADTGVAELQRIMDVNVWANKVVLDAIFETEKKVCQVVAISSGASVNGNRGWNGYAISKAALNMLIQLYARERPQIHYTSLAPGLVDTAMQDYLCALPADRRFTSLENLKSRRNTADMPDPSEAAAMLVDVIDRMPRIVSSGQFVDVRNLPE